MKNIKVRKLGLWGALVSGLMMLSAIAANSVQAPVKNAEHYDCMSTCYSNYRVCLMAGNPQSYCANQYQMCTIGCSGGGTNGAAREAS